MLTILIALSGILIIDAVRQEKKIENIRKSHNLKTYKENIH
jgi:hypothetical protein